MALVPERNVRSKIVAGNYRDMIGVGPPLVIPISVEKDIVGARDEVAKSQGSLPGNGIHGRDSNPGNGLDGMGCSPHHYSLRSTTGLFQGGV